MDYGTLIFRTIIMYFFTLFIFRLMGKREIGELSVFDLVIFLMIAEIVAIVLERKETGLLFAFLPIGVLALLQIVLSFITLKSTKVRRIMEGDPIMIIKKGKIDERAMRKIRYNFEDVLTQLREQGVADIRDVSYAIVETSGKMSVFRTEEDNFNLAIILDGEIQTENIEILGITESWVRERLRNIETISYASYKNGRWFIDERDEHGKKTILT